MYWRPAFLLAALASALLLPHIAPAQPASPNPTREAVLVRQDFSDCGNAGISDADSTKVGGVVRVVRGADGVTRVKVAMTAKRNTTYHFFLKCVRLLGDITTQDEGEAIVEFQFPTNSVGDSFAFDMYPEGAPAGEKFQSVPIKF
jgi:hypothetical protein